MALLAAGCGVDGDGAGGVATGASSGATATTAAEATTSQPTTATPSTAAPLAPDEALAAVQAAAGAVLDAGTGRYRASFRFEGGGTTFVVTHEGEWDDAAGLREVHVRVVVPGEPSAEFTVVDDGTGSLLMRNPALTGDPARPWTRFGPDDLPEGSGLFGDPGDAANSHTRLTGALLGAVSAGSSATGFVAGIDGVAALALLPSDLLGREGLTVDDVVDDPAEVEVHVEVDGDGRLASGSLDLADVALAVVQATGGVPAGVEGDFFDAVYEEETLQLGGSVGIPLPQPSEVVEAGGD